MPAQTKADSSVTHWVRVSLRGDELTPHGPYPDSATAEIVVARLNAVCKVLHQQVTIDIRSSAADSPVKKRA